MASSLHLIAVLCLTSGLWIGNAQCQDCCDPCKTCPSGWTQYKDNCYMYHHAPKDWADAERACIALGGNLASIANLGEHDFLKALINRVTDINDQTWVGAHDTTKEGVWMWSDGSKYTNFNGLWGPGEPNNGGGKEHCMEMNYRGKPNDNACTIKKPYFCGRHL
uniref:galactose-specific lectin nattectin-like n=1 Tax=Epinephelus lanceolatus TaxID=310571 RepID=UPI001445E39C|nr:galactose-specific lectin nattectin-like [Epinephelus lanceolatus]